MSTALGEPKRAARAGLHGDRFGILVQVPKDGRPRQVVAGRRETNRVTTLELLVDFCRAGTLGQLSCGRRLDELQADFGPFDGRADDRKPRRWRPRLHFWGDLEVMICHATVISFSLQTWRSELHLPEALGLGDRTLPSLFLHADLVEALDQAGIGWVGAPELIIGGNSDEALGLRTTETNVELAFWRYDPTGGADARLRLKGAYKRDQDVYCGPHPDSGPPRS